MLWMRVVAKPDVTPQHKKRTHKRTNKDNAWHGSMRPLCLGSSRGRDDTKDAVTGQQTSLGRAGGLNHTAHWVGEGGEA